MSELRNQPFDEAYDVDDPEDVASNMADTPDAYGRPVAPAMSPEGEEEEEDDDRGDSPPQTAGDSPEYGSEYSGSDLSPIKEEANKPQSEGAYDSRNYDSLNVSADVKELFSYISRYTPQVAEIEPKLKPFIPDFIPAVGDIDAMLKVERPDGLQETLGFSVLDEPCAAQSDPTVLDLQLRSISKTASSKSVNVKQIDGQTDTKAIDSWITSITELHKDKPPQSVNYSANMPEIDTLMQEWPPEFENLLAKAQLPGADLNISLKEYVSIVCALTDIPIHKSRIESLHVLFTLFREFKDSQHFQSANDTTAEEKEPEVIAFN